MPIIDGLKDLLNGNTDDAVETDAAVTSTNTNTTTTTTDTATASEIGQENQEAILTKVAQLLKESQTNEKRLYTELKVELDSVSNGKPPRLSLEERDELVSEINYESEKRQNYYELVKSARGAQLAAETMAAKAAHQQILTMRLIEKYLDKSKAALNALAEDRQKKMKMVEINTYYGKQFGGYAALGRGVVAVCALLLISAYLKKRFDKLSMVFWVVDMAVKWLGGIYILYLLYDLVSRRNDNYDEFIFPMAPRTDAELVNANSLSGPGIDISGIDIPGLCAGSYCCGPGTTWSDSSGCVLDPNNVIE